jgi:predicted ribosomally synthesized peptide with nif11-like leader
MQIYIYKRRRKMSKEQFEKFTETVLSENPKLVDDLMKLSGPRELKEKLVELGKTHGYEFSETDVSITDSKRKKITEEELEEVAGGGDWDWVRGGRGLRLTRARTWTKRGRIMC